MRAAYINLIVQRDCPKNQADILWAARAAGHFIDSEDTSDSQLAALLTTLSYWDYYVADKVEFTSDLKFSSLTLEQVREMTMTGKAATIRVFNEDAKAIRSIQIDLGLENQQLVIREFLTMYTEREKLKEELNQLKYENQQLKTKNDELEDKLENLPSSTQTKSDKKDNVDYESLDNAALRAIRTTEGAYEKIRRSFLAICAYNDNQTTFDARWVINNQALRQLSGVSGLIVKQWMVTHELAISDHNNKYDLTLYHNKRHSGTPITSVIAWEGDELVENHFISV